MPSLLRKKATFADASKMDSEFDFILQSVGGSEHYRVSGDEEIVEGFVRAFLPLFDNYSSDASGVQKVQILQCKTASLQIRLKTFVAEHGKKWPPLYGVPAFLEKLGCDEPFLFLPGIHPSPSERLLLHDFLKSKKEGKDFEALHNESKELFGDLLENYDMRAFGRKRYVSGEQAKRNRICRFCQRDAQQTSFGNRAHALSEAIGNKLLFVYDECDDCNERFSRTIEDDIVAYFSFFRTFYGIKGKGGNKTLTGKGFALRNDGQLVLSFKDGFAWKKDEDENSFSLEILSRYVPQNVYKMLCKFFISLVRMEELPYFSQTIDWINDRPTAGKLPPIAILFSEAAVKKHPQLCLYLRQASDATLPFAVGDFSLATIRFVFLVPFCTSDDRDFTNPVDFDRFWKSFKHFEGAKGWRFEDFSCAEKKDFLSTLRIEKKDNAGRLIAPALFSSPSLGVGAGG